MKRLSSQCLGPIQVRGVAAVLEEVSWMGATSVRIDQVRFHRCSYLAWRTSTGRECIVNPITITSSTVF